MLTIGGTLLKEDLKEVAEMVVGDKGTFWVAAGDVDERLRPKWVVDEDDCDEVDEDVEKRWTREEPRERPKREENREE